MNVHVSHFLPLGIAAGLAIAPSLPAQGQATDIPVTGGRLILDGTSIFVPGEAFTTPNGSILFVLPDSSFAEIPSDQVSLDGRTVIYEGDVGPSLLIQTQQGNIPLNAIFDPSFLPSLSTARNGVPAAGDTGSVLGTLTFRGFTAAGEPAFFNDIPTELEFQVTSILPRFDEFGTRLNPEDTTAYNTDVLIIEESGAVTTGSGSFGVDRSTGAVFVQYQPGRDLPIGQIVDVNNILVNVPADEFTFQRYGVSYFADITTSLTGGSITVPVPPGFGTEQSAAQAPVDPVPVIPPIFVIIPDFTPGIWNPSNPFAGSTQFSPVLPNAFGIVFIFTSVPSGLMYDPPIVASADQTSVGFEFEMMPRPVEVGLPSRVFPGMTGAEMREDSTFTAITEFPQRINLNNPFTVYVGDRFLGEFEPGDTVVFSDYADQLGDLLVDGEGVDSFVIGGIEPGIDTSDPRVFPVRLEFSTDRASFEMRPAPGEPRLGQSSTETPVSEIPSGNETLDEVSAIAPTLDDSVESFSRLDSETTELPTAESVNAEPLAAIAPAAYSGNNQ